MENQGPAPEESDLSPAPEPTELETLRAELDEAERERVQFKNLVQRVQADFVNFRRRAEEEQTEFQRHASAQIILKLLPVLDDLERAAGQGPGEADGSDAGLLEGVRLIARKFVATLEEVGVQRVEAMDKPFDPWEHEVVSYNETTEHPDGRVLAVAREGYILHGRVIRPALVTVAKAPQEPAEQQGPSAESDGGTPPTGE